MPQNLQKTKLPSSKQAPRAWGQAKFLKFLKFLQAKFLISPVPILNACPYFEKGTGGILTDLKTPANLTLYSKFLIGGAYAENSENLRQRP
jgi:hypothetical protein